jgi:hypothetical protein
MRARFSLSLHSDLWGTAKAYCLLKKPALTVTSVHGGCPTTQSASEPEHGHLQIQLRLLHGMVLTTSYPKVNQKRK